MTKPTIAFIGGGRLATSLIQGLLQNHTTKDHIWVTNRSEAHSEAFKKTFGIHTTQANDVAVNAADVVVLSVKPQQLEAVTKEIAETVQSKAPLIISVAAGVKEAMIDAWLGGGQAIVRVMPNTPALIGCSATGMFANSYVTELQREIAESLLRSVGITVWLSKESDLDIVTALSGSGPAYFFYVIEALQKAAIACGLSQEAAKDLSLQTAFGACRLALESDVDVAELRERVTSPKGTTESAINVLEKEGMASIWQHAIEAAIQRAEALSKPSD